MPKAKCSNPGMPKAPAGKQRWSDGWPSKPQVERRVAQRIGGDTGSMDKPVTKAK